MPPWIREIFMQKILGNMRKAIQQYKMIENGDRIAVGISGGKDSLILLKGLAKLRSFIGIDYEIVGITIDPQFGGKSGDYSIPEKICGELEIPYYIIPTYIGEVVFDIRREKNPCSLCARMRRGAIHGAASEFSCNKIALGHNFDDTVETFIMNLFNEGRIGCYSPKTLLDDKNLTVIRPMIYCKEREIRRAVRTSGIQVVKSICPVDGHTNRQKKKEFIAEMERRDHGFKDRIFGALQRGNIDGWGI